MAGFGKLNALMEPRQQTMPQGRFSGRRYDPTIVQMLQQQFRHSNPIMTEMGTYEEAPQEVPPQQLTLADTGFAEYLRNNPVPFQPNGLSSDSRFRMGAEMLGNPALRNQLMWERLSGWLGR